MIKDKVRWRGLLAIDKRRLEQMNLEPTILPFHEVTTALAYQSMINSLGIDQKK